MIAHCAAVCLSIMTPRFSSMSREFCGMVRKIVILTKEEVQRMSPGTINLKGEENSSVAEGVDSKEMKHLPTSSSGPDDC